MLYSKDIYGIGLRVKLAILTGCSYDVRKKSSAWYADIQGHAVKVVKSQSALVKYLQAENQGFSASVQALMDRGMTFSLNYFFNLLVLSTKGRSCLP